tara:strand:- start:8140 stop:8454 length:315 start_codon:yes stop_codon:yes gene_type:complete
MSWWDVIKRKDYAKERFIRDNPKIKFKLTEHAKERLAKRMGWSFKVTRTMIPGGKITMSLDESNVKAAKGGWKVLINGWGWFVLKNVGSKNNPRFIAVTFYRDV